MEDGWIEWAGGECPVSGRVLVDVMFRDGGEQDRTEAGYWADATDGANCWKAIGSGSDIIAYRVVSS